MGFKIDFKGRHLTALIASVVLLVFTFTFLPGTVLFFAFIMLSLGVGVLPFF
ncbi:MAG: hypothetical protein ACLFNK_02555 [Candidatus Woesearchaeota archaeon]